MDGSARLSWALVLLAVAFGLVAGTVTFATGIGDENIRSPGPEYRPPLFFLIANGIYVLAILSSIPRLAASFSALARREWRSALHGYLHFLASIVVYFAFFKGSHLIGCTGVNFVCLDGSFTGRAHLLHHTVAPALPLAALLSVALDLLKPRA